MMLRHNIIPGGKRILASVQQSNDEAETRVASRLGLEVRQLRSGPAIAA